MTVLKNAIKAQPTKQVLNEVNNNQCVVKWLVLGNLFVLR